MMLVYNANIQYNMYAGILACVSKRKHIACIVVYDTNVQADLIFMHVIVSGIA